MFRNLFSLKMLLKKYKIEKFFSQNPKSFFVMELLPMKEASFVILVQKLNKLGLKVTSFKSKYAGDILNSLLSNGGVSQIKEILKGNLVFVYSNSTDSTLIIKELVKNPKTNKEFFQKLLLLCVYQEGHFYHVDTFLKQDSNDALVLTGSLEQGPKMFIKILEDPFISVVRILDFKK